VDDRIQISLQAEGITNILEKFSTYIETETLSSIILNITNPILEKEIEIDDLKINLKLNK
jgi:hypothetical protein